eukprot:3819770-Pleurochrysis_carterae.AAC.1
MIFGNCSSVRCSCCLYCDLHLLEVGGAAARSAYQGEGRVAADKFYEGGHWHLFCCGVGKAPGGPVMVASVVKLVADFYEELAATAAR